MVQNLPQSAALRLTIAPESHHVQPGEQAVYVVTLENSSNAAQVQNLSIGGVPDAWFRVEFDAQRRAFPGEQRTATLFVTVPTGTPASKQMLEITARAGTTIESKISCELEVLGVAGAASAAAPPPPPVAQAPAPPPPPSPPPPPVQAPSPSIPASPAPIVSLRPGLVISHGDGSSERITVSIRNPAGTPVDYGVSLSGLESGWYTLPPRLRIPPGQTIETEMRLHPPQRAKVADYPFEIRVTVDGYAQVFAEANGWLSLQAAPSAPSPPPPPPPSRPVATPMPPPPPPPSPPPVAPRPAAGVPMAAQPIAAPSPAPVPQVDAILPPDVSLAPRTTFKFGVGEISAQAIITMRNRAKLVERYTVSVEGIPAEWYALSIADVRLEPNTNTQIPLRLAPQTGSGWPAGDYEFRIRVVPHSIPENTVEVGGLISITGVTTFDARMTPVQAEGASRVFDVTVVNTGDLAMTPVITASDPEGKCVFRIPKTRTLDPAQEGLFHIKVGAKRSAILGTPETFDFRIRVAPTAEAPDSVSRMLDARFIHKAKFGFRAAFMLAFFAVLVGVVTLVVSFAKPTIIDAADWVGCQLDSKYRFAVDDSAEITKESCGGDPRDTKLDEWLNRPRTQPTSLVQPSIVWPAVVSQGYTSTEPVRRGS